MGEKRVGLDKMGMRKKKEHWGRPHSSKAFLRRGKIIWGRRGRISIGGRSFYSNPSVSPSCQMEGGRKGRCSVS